MKSHRVRPAVTPFEDRQTPAGNIAANLVAGSLSLTGDQLDNSLAVTQTAPDTFTITPEDGTTINRSADPVTFQRVRADLIINLGRGNDRVRFGTSFFEPFVPGEAVAVGRDLRIDGGSGENTIELPRAALDVGRHLRITNGAGFDRTELRGPLNVGGDLIVSNGDGFNATFITPDRSGLAFAGTNSVLGNLTIKNGRGGADSNVVDTDVGGDVHFENAGSGSNGFSMINGFGTSQAPDRAWIGGDVTFRTGPGSALNAVSATDVRGSILLQAGAGDAVLRVESTPVGDVTVAGDVTIRGDVGQTRVELGSDFSLEAGLTIGGGLDVTTGAGGDIVMMTKVRVNGGTTLDLGTDDDRLTIDDSSFRGPLGVFAGRGADEVRVESQSPSGDDAEAFAGRTDIWGASRFDLGDGADTLQLGVPDEPARQVRLLAPARADGGTGSDLLDAGNAVPASRLTTTRFERLAPPPVFLPPVRYTVGEYVLDATVADLTGDGKPDLVSANADSGTVSVLINAGDGTFFPAGDFDAGESPFAVAVADFNGDTIPDLAVANNTQSPNGTVSILLGSGFGFFDAPTVFSIGTQADTVDVEVADFNGDGIVDMVTANRAGNNEASTSILLGAGDGRFGPATQYFLSDDPIAFHTGFGQDVAVGDLNGDGKTDVVLSGLRAVGAFLGNGDGTLTRKFAESCGVSTQVALGDLNGDGKLDLVEANNGTVLFGVGDGTFGAPVVWAADGAISVALGDFNKDGELDIAATTFDDGGVVVLGNGTGTVADPRPFNPGPDGGPLTVADFNGDGWDDLAVGNQEFESVSVLLNRKTPA